MRQNFEVFLENIFIMDDNEKRFTQCVDDVKKLKSDPTNDEMLEVYALYKQAMVGNCNIDAPGFFDFKGKAKWDAWNAKKGISSELAKTAYVKYVDGLKKTYGF